MIETAPRPTIRTIVASFLFTDLVGFSKGTATDQYAAKANLSAALRQHLAALRESDYWIKDTGDGALIAFVSNPEHALYMALALARDYGAAAGTESEAAARLRTGLHLGTVKESIDVEARRNFIGDGINAAKRIMDFALPGQIAASRSFFEAIANLDAAYAALFRHLGAPDDKHGRAHELYEVAPSESVLEKLRTEITAERAETGSAGSTAPMPSAAVETASGPRRKKRYALFIGIAVVLAIFATRMREAPPRHENDSIEAPPAAVLGQGPAKEEAGAQPGAAASPAGSAAKGQPSEAPQSTTLSTESRPSVDRTKRSSAEAAHAGTAASPPATGVIGERSRSVPRPSADAAATEASSPRCSRIVEKAALGEPLTADEKRELASTCR